MNALFRPRYLEPGSSWEILVTVLIGMLMMVMIHCLVTAVRGREKNYLFLGLFYVGALINSTGNIYVTFFVTTIEPYIGSWIMMGSFVLFVESYLALPERRARVLIGKTILVISAILLVVSVGHNLMLGRQDTRIIYAMDVITAVFLLLLFSFLLSLAVRGNRKALYLFFLELTIVVGGIAALGIVKNSVVNMGLFPIEFFQSNLIFIVGMTLNGIIFPSLLSFDVMHLKVKTAVAEQRNQELRELDAAKNDLIMNLSHEFRTPITIIGGVAKQLKGGKWGDSISANRKNLEVIERNNLRLHKQVDGMLRLASMEQRQQDMTPIPIDVQSRLNALVGEFSSVAELKRITIDVSVPDRLQVVADADLFRTALVNLVGNALKFTPEGGAVSVCAFRSHREVRVVVDDTGPGIPEKEQQRVFHRFHRLPVPGNARMGGSGIGLSLVKRVMERHSGTVELESSVGKGSTFTLVFPVSEWANASAAGVSPDSGRAFASGKDDCDPLINGHQAEIIGGIPRDDDPPINSAKPVVLVVEDDPELRGHLTGELSSGFSLLTARHGRDALQQMDHRIPDLVISDVMMPEMDGYQLHEAMSRDERLRMVPVLFLTARDSESERISAYTQGIVDYITKPFSVEMVASRARNIIETNDSFKKGYQHYLKRSMMSFIDNLSSGENSDPEQEFNFSDHCRASQLTERETEVALLVRKGLSDKEIASTLGISAKTIGNYNSSIFKKCDFTGRLDLVAWGRTREPESPET